MSDVISIGMLRGSGRPGSVALANAHAAMMQGARLHFFTPADVDLGERRIDALRYDGSGWRRERIAFPDVIENDEASRASAPVWEELTRSIPFTTPLLGGKSEVSRRMKAARLYEDLLIPGHLIREFPDFLDGLDRYGRAVVKPAKGSKGRDIFYFEKCGSGYRANISVNAEEFDAAGALAFYESTLRGRTFLVQRYVESRTSRGQPYDVRLHLRRNHEAKWQTVKIYARLGSGRTITSNLATGGSIAPARSFLENQFGSKGSSILRTLERLAREFPERFQTLYPEQMLDALGLDIGLDGDGRPWLFEVNSFPGAMFFEMDDAVPRMGYAIYLAKMRSGRFARVDSQMESASPDE